MEDFSSLYADYGELAVDTPTADMAGLGAMFAAMGIMSTITSLVMMALYIVGYWKMFTKAGKPGWAAIVPIYNVYVMLEMVGRPWWWLLIMIFVPFANIIFMIILMNDISKAFGRGVGTTLGLIFLGPIFPLVLGFGSAEYKMPVRK